MGTNRGTNRGMHNGSSMTFLMYLVDLKDFILKVSWHYLYFWLKYKHLKSQWYKQGYTQCVIHDGLDLPCRPQPSYPESFLTLS